MPQDISTLMDGELNGQAAQAALLRMEAAEDLRDRWFVYHLIRDALKREVTLSGDLASGVGQRLVREPRVLAPRWPLASRLKVAAVSLAASVAAIAVVAWVLFQNPQDRLREPIAMAELSNPVHFPAAQQLNDYLIAHQEYSPSTTIQGVAPHVRTVADSKRETR